MALSKPPVTCIHLIHIATHNRHCLKPHKPLSIPPVACIQLIYIVCQETYTEDPQSLAASIPPVACTHLIHIATQNWNCLCLATRDQYKKPHEYLIIHTSCGLHPSYSQSHIELALSTPCVTKPIFKATQYGIVQTSCGLHPSHSHNHPKLVLSKATQVFGNTSCGLYPSHSHSHTKLALSKPHKYVIIHTPCGLAISTPCVKRPRLKATQVCLCP